jgi:hypothetical protein
LALSYVWGSSTKGVLTLATAEHYHREGSLTKDAVPRLIFDSMELVSRLGERCLWVDSVCVTQDDLHDKQRHLPIIHAIYNHAIMTIIAVVEHADDGLPRLRKCSQPHSTQTRIEVLNGVEFTTALCSLEATMSQATWNKRGWTFQEGLLARRALVFTDHQVYWNCPVDSWCEDRHAEFHDHRHQPTEQNSILAAMYSEDPKQGARRPILSNKSFMYFYSLGVYL